MSNAICFRQKGLMSKGPSRCRYLREPSQGEYACAAEGFSMRASSLDHRIEGEQVLITADYLRRAKGRKLPLCEFRLLQGAKRLLYPVWKVGAWLIVGFASWLLKRFLDDGFPWKP